MMLPTTDTGPEREWGPRKYCLNDKSMNSMSHTLDALRRALDAKIESLTKTVGYKVNIQKSKATMKHLKQKSGKTSHLL